MRIPIQLWRGTTSTAASTMPSKINTMPTVLSRVFFSCLQFLFAPHLQGGRKVNTATEVFTVICDHIDNTCGENITVEKLALLYKCVVSSETVDCLGGNIKWGVLQRDSMLWAVGFWMG